MKTEMSSIRFFIQLTVHLKNIHYRDRYLNLFFGVHFEMCLLKVIPLINAH